ncbi:MAG: C25 family cysteine peptidase, partial [Planctomycetes bacterium]|nr:C25 family cysteine peptidase [Planctomycetota bacterium]
MRAWFLPLLLAASALPCAGADGPEWIVLAPPDLADAAEALARHRRASGLDAAVKPAGELAAAEGGLDPRTVKDFVRKAYAESRGRLATLLLLGDAPSPRDPAGLLRVPPKVLEPRYSDKRWSCAPELASDAWYAMLDDDAVPDLAVGRLPADTAEEASAMVRRIVAYETTAGFGEWRRRLDIVAGPGGFGPLVDMFLESTFRKYVSELIPPAFDVRITYANPVSPYCYPLPRFPEKVLELVNEGSLVWAYVGHGSPFAFDRVRGEGGDRS